MKKGLIIGPISNSGGREVEVNIILKAIQNVFKVKVLSTSYITNDSFALQDIKNPKFSSLDIILYKKHIFIKVLSQISKSINRGNKKNYGYVNNSFVKKIINLEKYYLKELKSQIDQVDFVILCVQLTSKYLPDIINYCYKNNIKTFVRTTGTIRQIDLKDYIFLKKVTLFIHHSISNANNLNSQLNLPYTIIDQCALTEDDLLKISLSITNNNITFGYLGRLSPEKGINELTNYFIDKDLNFVFAGDGMLKDSILRKVNNNPKIQYLGLIKSNKIVDFFNMIDVLIIPSFEESGPLVGLEAMAAGKIIISTKVGSMEERLINIDNPFWFQIENLNTLDYQISLILNKSTDELLKIKKLIRQRYIDEYKFEEISKKYISTICNYLN